MANEHCIKWFTMYIIVNNNYKCYKRPNLSTKNRRLKVFKMHYKKDH